VGVLQYSSRSSSGLAPDSRYQALIGCSAFCGLFAHLFNRAIGGGEVQPSIRTADQCGGKLLPGLARDLALSKIELVLP
jgi:hypothetical protein